ncbi:uncharacterized protein A1O9_03671 [Exophiala aquamarina CBS 119918]|uniref:AAA+ ATPase domain-containing protein n=1 Tax=Exophiala aquamarina CBS 119918 TaxID=1182545 RepID=A0A072PHR0_9EURO|nr:uncharacterized protein A1O9_03671 [Exophiala aquamarina CBS 119918]KEF58828.1 hypothetical protein A1O9_03671 [Exophiala aquamarina CBS 119918]
MTTFTVRPSNTDKEAFRINLNAVSLFSMKLKSGDTCEIHGGSVNPSDRRKLAIAWEASGIKDYVVQTSRVLQECYGLKLGDKITISRTVGRVQDADVVTFQPSGPGLQPEAAKFYAMYAKHTIPGIHEHLAISQRIVLKLGIDSTEFFVKDIGVEGDMIARITRESSFRISSPEDSEQIINIDFRPARLGGLEQEVIKLRKIVHRLRRTTVRQSWATHRPVQGVLIYGAKGTGKSAFIQALAESGWPSVVNWATSIKISPTTEPRLIIVDLRYLSRESRETSSMSPASLHDLFKQIRGSPTLVVAEILHPNDIHQSLRAQGEFEAEIELPIPSMQQRMQILIAIRENEASPDDELLQTMAEKTHGYVGADLYALFRETLEIAADRAENENEESSPGSKGAYAYQSEKAAPLNENTDWLAGTNSAMKQESSLLRVSHHDFEQALQEIRPSALQEIFLETPTVRWSDIGGQHEIKKQLQNAIERPLKYAERMHRIGLLPKKGVLLYGPPGCSKTLLVRALATEAGLNFLAVKGAELISMYVGESERATREVFRKARAASPSIIFFDEIDAIASRGKSGSDLNVLTTLLNEMDGFEELRNVLVVAATNKPQNIDPALMRPGRFDNVVYIGPPDLEARTEIFQNRFGKFAYEPQTGIEEDAQHFASLTEGFSGAEIVGICQTAGEFAMDADRDSTLPEDIEKAIKMTPKSITSQMVFEFESWNSARRR